MSLEFYLVQSESPPCSIRPLITPYVSHQPPDRYWALIESLLANCKQKYSEVSIYFNGVVHYRGVPVNFSPAKEVSWTEGS